MGVMPSELAKGKQRGSGPKAIFVGERGLRSGWRFLIFLALVVAGRFLAQAIVQHFGARVSDEWSAPNLLLGGAAGFCVTLAAAWVMGRIERRGLSSYGLALRSAFGARFWEGFGWGLAAVVVLMLLISLGHGYSIEGPALQGRGLLVAAALWLAVFLFVGLGEEALFRGYPLFALGEGLGFWPAAALLSAGFGALHYFGKPLENWMDGVSVTLIGLFLCLTLRRTGSLWFAIGFHASFDYAALFVFANPNTGLKGHSLPETLVRASFHGPNWLTGGPRGAEASACVFLVLAGLFVLFDRTHRGIHFPLPEMSRPSIARSGTTPERVATDARML